MAGIHGGSPARARAAHADFLRRYAGAGVTAETTPLVKLNTLDWERPFSVLEAA